MRRSQTSALGAILVLATLVGLCQALTARSAWAATVFSNYTASNCKCGFGAGFYAEEFSPSSDFDFISAAAFVDNTDIEAQSFSMGLYLVAPRLAAVDERNSDRARDKRDPCQREQQRIADPAAKRN